MAANMDVERRDSTVSNVSDSSMSIVGSESSAAENGRVMIVSEDDQRQSDALKDDGNSMFAAGKYTGAVLAYTEAIKLSPSAALFCNRAFCQLKLENYGSAVQDAEEAVKLDPSFIKAYYRKGSALSAIGKYKEAKAQFNIVLKLKPGDKDAKAKYDEADKQVKRVAFEAAIATEPGEPTSRKVDVNSITVDASYKGPHLPAMPGASDGYSIRSYSSGSASVLSSSTPVDPARLVEDKEATNEYGLSREFVEGLLAEYKAQRLVHRKFVIELLLRAKRHLSSQPSLVRVSWPETADHFNVCGDTHGQYYDTCNIFEKQSGMPGPSNPYVFNGDFVDRGSWSVENCLLLLSWMLLYPRHFFLTRGNHETRNMNRMYGFDGEVKHKYDQTVLDLFTEVFCSIPLGVVVDDRVLVVHGGLPTVDNVRLTDLEKIDRNREPPESCLMSDLLWSDPQPFPGRGPSKRGVGKSFGPDITSKFLAENGLDLLVRSHEVRDDGFLVEHSGKCITVFSAPNYCDQMGNKGGVVRLVRRAGREASGRILKAGEAPQGGDYTLAHPELLNFTAVPHPPVKPMAYAGGMAGLFGL